MTNNIVSQFIENPASKNSIANRRLVFGAGINDADYHTQPKINGKRLTCPYYSKWTDMLTRCYSLSFQKRKPTYKYCSVINDWLLFSNFKHWMKSQDWKNKDLDKDIIKPGNKVYSAEYCCFVIPSINSLLIDCAASRGKWPVGVYYHKGAKKFVAQIRTNGKQNYLGLFATADEANATYKQFKSKHIIEIANKQNDPRIKNGLLLHAKVLRDS